MASVPHEKEVVERFKNRPFVLIGVNGDADKEIAKKAVEKHAIPWRSFWNEKGAGGPIVTAWNVIVWPSAFVIDEKGIIRHKHVDIGQIEKHLEKLVSETEAMKK
jgi:peroxiredoxin